MSVFSKMNNPNEINDAQPPVDASIRIIIANKELDAFIDIEPPSNGGKEPTLEDMRAALARSGVSYNIDMQKLNELAVNPLYRKEIPIAKGVAPANGADGTASFLIETEKVLRPRENAEGKVDFRDLGIVENVKKGQVLCKITAPTEGTPGMSVKGKELSARRGRPVPSYVGKNTELSADGSAILSKIDGQVEFDGRKINVDETFYVQGNVDHSTGNIKVLRNLVVRGMVMPGFKLEAGGNIEVDGTIEAAKIKAGGNVVLKSGITSSELDCGGDLKSRFIENCDVFARGEIQAEYIFSSNIKCGKSLKIVGMIAKIIGGSCIVGQNVVANTIGSPANVKTRLELGTDPSIIVRQQELVMEIPRLEKQINSLKPLLTMLRQLEAANRLTPDKVETLEKVSYSYETSVEQMEDAKKEMEEITQALHVRGFGRVICSGIIYPETTVVIGSASYYVMDSLKNTSLYYDEGEIKMGSAI